MFTGFPAIIQQGKRYIFRQIRNSSCRPFIATEGGLNGYIVVGHRAISEVRTEMNEVLFVVDSIEFKAVTVFSKDKLPVPQNHRGQ